MTMGIERRTGQLEVRVGRFSADLDDIRRRLARAEEQQTRQGQQALGGSTPAIYVGYITAGCAGMAANSNTMPTGTIKLAIAADPTTATNPVTGVFTDQGQAGQTFYNWTGGTIPSNVRGSVFKSSNKLYYNGHDCSGVAAATPATPTTTTTTTGGGTAPSNQADSTDSGDSGGTTPTPTPTPAPTPVTNTDSTGASS